MEYEFYFLDNINDFIDTVNVELDVFINSIIDDNYFDINCLKRIIMNLINFCELLIKFRLEEEHWAFAFADINNASYDSYINGNFISVNFKDGINRLQRICQVKCEFIAFKCIYQYRNDLVYYILSNTYKCILKNITEAMNELVKFSNNIIVDFLPSELTKDFYDLINEYIKCFKRLDDMKDKYF